MAQENLARRECFNNLVVGFKYVLPFKHGRARQIHAVSTDRVVNLQVILLTNLEVLLPVCRCCVNTAGTRVSGHVITQH